jgi:hypothetical protein
LQGAGRRIKEEEDEVLAWIAQILGEACPAGVAYDDYLRDGQILCRVMNKLKPGAVKKINTSGAQFKFMENISWYRLLLI